MEFDIVSLQVEPKLVFHFGIEFDKLIVSKINSLMANVDTKDYGFETLIFSISAKLGVKDYIIGDIIESRKRKSKTVVIFITSDYLEDMDDIVLHPKIFDFQRKRNVLKTYSKSKYLQFVLNALDEFLPNLKINYSKVYEEILDIVQNNPQEFIWKNEAVMYLEYLNSEVGRNWLNSSQDGKEFAKSEIGEKWIYLLNKYHFDSFGNLIFADDF